MKVIVLRGPSGAGKSTYAKALGGAIVSADTHRYKDGVYTFVPEETGHCHAQCFLQFLGLLRIASPLVIVDNTNTTAMEISPYMLGAAAFGYEAEIHTFEVHETDLDKLVRNVHNVPTRTIEHQWRNTSLSLPSYWKEVKVPVGFDHE